MFLSFGIPTGCIDVSSICVSAVDLFEALQVLLESSFVIFSVILFPTKLHVGSAVF